MSPPDARVGLNFPAYFPKLNALPSRVAKEEQGWI